MTQPSLTTIATIEMRQSDHADHALEGVLRQNVPETARFRQDAGNTIAYLDIRATNGQTREVIENLGKEVAERIKI